MLDQQSTRLSEIHGMPGVLLLIARLAKQLDITPAIRAALRERKNMINVEFGLNGLSAINAPRSLKDKQRFNVGSGVSFIISRLLRAPSGFVFSPFMRVLRLPFPMLRIHRAFATSISLSGVLQDAFRVQRLVSGLRLLRSFRIKHSYAGGAFPLAGNAGAVQRRSMYRGVSFWTKLPISIMREASGLGFRSCHGGIVT